MHREAKAKSENFLIHRGGSMHGEAHHNYRHMGISISGGGALSFSIHLVILIFLSAFLSLRLRFPPLFPVVCDAGSCPIEI